MRSPTSGQNARALSDLGFGISCLGCGRVKQVAARRGRVNWIVTHDVTCARVINTGTPPKFGEPTGNKQLDDLVAHQLGEPVLTQLGDVVPEHEALAHLGSRLKVDFITAFFPIHGSLDDVPPALCTTRKTVERSDRKGNSWDWRTSWQVFETPQGIKYGLAVFSEPGSETAMGWLRMNPAAHLRSIGEDPGGFARTGELIAEVYEDLKQYIRPRGPLDALTLSRVDLALDYSFAGPSAPIIDGLYRALRGTGVVGRLYLNKSPDAPLGFTTATRKAGHVSVHDIRFDPRRGSHDYRFPIRVEVRARRDGGKGWLDEYGIDRVEDLDPITCARLYLHRTAKLTAHTVSSRSMFTAVLYQWCNERNLSRSVRRGLLGMETERFDLGFKPDASNGTRARYNEMRRDLGMSIGSEQGPVFAFDPYSATLVSPQLVETGCGACRAP